MKVLITGGAGYIGSTLVGHLLDKGYNVTVIDNLQYNQLSLLPYFNNKQFKFINGDVKNLPSLTSLCFYDVIIPLAAIVGMPACDANPDLATLVNYEQIRYIVSNTSKEQQLIIPNTNSQYGSSTEVITEDSLFNPLSLYAKTKCWAEQEVLDSIRSGVALRLATVFGISPRMRLDLLVNDFVYKAVTDKVLVLFQADFKRNYIHVQDIARAFVFMIENYSKAVGRPYNVGLSNANLSKAELAEKVKIFLPETTIIRNDFSEDADKRNYIVSNERIEQLGFKPQVSIEEGIQELIEGYKMIIPNRNKLFTNL